MRRNSVAAVPIAAVMLMALLFPVRALAQIRFPFPYPYPSGYPAAAESSLRLAVTPKEAAVYVDGYFAGNVDDFDGTFQRLRVLPGQHEVVIYVEGYRTFRQNLYLGPRSTRKITATLARLAPGEPSEPPPVPLQPPQQSPVGRGGPSQRRDGQPPPPPVQQPTTEGIQTSSFGTVAIHIQPAGADVIIDGEHWTGPQDDERLIVQLAEGRHVVEIRKDGYRMYTTEVSVRRGETTPLDVSLTRQ